MPNLARSPGWVAVSGILQQRATVGQMKVYMVDLRSTVARLKTQRPVLGPAAHVIYLPATIF